MRKWIRRGFLTASITALVIGLVVVAAGLWLVPRPEVQTWLRIQIAGATGPGVEFDSVSLALWPALGIRLHEVRFTEEGKQEKGEVATIGSLSCTLRKDALLDGEFVLDKIYVEQPILSLEREANGEWILGGSLPQLINHSMKVDEGEVLPPSVSAYPKSTFVIRDGQMDLKGQRPDGTKVSFHIRHLDVEFRLPRHGDHGLLTLEMDTPNGGELSVDATLRSSVPATSPETYSIDARVRGDSLQSAGQLLYLLTGLPIRMLNGVQNIEGSIFIDPAGNAKGQATVNVPTGSIVGWGIQVSTPARLEGFFAFSEGAFSLHNAILRAPSAKIGTVSSEIFTAWFDWSAPDLDIKRIEMGAYGGTVQGKGAASFVGEHTFSMEMKASELDFRQVTSAISGEEVTDGFEKASMDAKLQGVWTGPETWLNTLQGNATINLAGGEMKSSRLLRSIFRATFGKIPGYSYVDRDQGALALKRLDLSCAIHDAACFTEDLVFISSGHHVTGTGSIGFDTKVNLRTRVVLTEGGMATIYGLASVPFRRKASPTFTPIPVNVSGSISKPNFVPDVSGISMAPFRAVLGLGRGVGRGAAGVGRGAVGVGKGVVGAGKGIVGFGAKVTQKVGGVFRLGRKRSAATEDEMDGLESEQPTSEFPIPEPLPDDQK